MGSSIRDLVPFGDIDAEVVKRAAGSFQVASVESVVAGFALGRAVVGLLEVMVSFLAELGLSPARWRLLIALAFQSGLAGATMGELAGHLGVKEPTVTATVDRLEDEGLVQREREPGDRRRVRVSLTPEGRSRVGEVLPVISAKIEGLVAALGGVGEAEDVARRIMIGVEAQ